MPKQRYAIPTKAFHITLPAPCARNASSRCTPPARAISHATTTLTAKAATNGEPTATMPKTISATPHKTETVEACRARSTGEFSAIQTSLESGISLPQKAHKLKAHQILLLEDSNKCAC